MRSFLLLALFLGFLVVGCGSESPVEPEAQEQIDATIPSSSRGQADVRRDDLLVIRLLTVDADGNTVIPVEADPSTLLYYRPTGNPVLAPDGHHVTAGEFSAVKSSLSVKCTSEGTLIRMQIRDALPNAMYRVWILAFREPGFDITGGFPFVNLTGEGALGLNDRSENTFFTSASGEGSIQRVHPPGLMSEVLPIPPFGGNDPVGDCLLTDVFEWHVIAAFQQPGQPGGPSVGPPAFFPNSAVEQFVFIFRE